jgi:hypothetical protein
MTFLKTNELEQLKYHLKQICNKCCKMNCQCFEKPDNYMKKWDTQQIKFLIECIEKNSLIEMKRTERGLYCQIGKMCLELPPNKLKMLAWIFKETLNFY